MPITHEEQKQKWNKEHAEPFALKQMDARKGSSSLEPFVEFLKKQKLNNLVGLEMGCGKGRNMIWLAEQVIVSKMHGFDFSDVAIVETRTRAHEANLADKTGFKIMDATRTWDYPSNSFDFGVDCTASTDIESPEGRQFAVNEMLRILKPGGYYLVYVMSTDDEYHKMLIGPPPKFHTQTLYNY